MGSFSRRENIVREVAAIVAVAVTWCAVLGSGRAIAQTGYPPAPPTTVMCSGGDVDAGTVSLGQTITVTLCGPFQPGAVLAATLNGGLGLGTAPTTADGVGAVTITIRARKCGLNKVIVTGPGSTTTTAVRTATFYVMCARAPIAGVLPFTGGNIVVFLLVAALLIGVGALTLTVYRRRT